MRVDLNADMGESFGPWPMGADAALLDVVTSANVACGFHGGDPDVMATTMRLAREKGVGVGAHPGFPDLQGFGRRRMQVPHGTLANMVRYQVGAALGMARAEGVELRHVKLHGALGNMTSEDEAMARACYEGALSVDPSLTLMVIAATAQERAAQALGAPYVAEIFADRAYEASGLLVDRRKPGAVIHDAEAAAERMVRFVTGGAVIAEDGTRIDARIDTICCHGDTPEAVDIARAVRAALEGAGVAVEMFQA